MRVSPRRKRDDNRLQTLWAADIGDHVIDLAFAPSGAWLAAASVSGPVAVYHVATGAPVASLLGHPFGTTALSWHPRGDALATAGQDGRVRIWDAVLWHERAALDGGSAWVEHIAYSPDGAWLATAAGKRLRIWDAAGELHREFSDHRATISDLAWRPGTHHVLVTAYGGIQLYSPHQAEPLLSLEYRGSPLVAAWSPNGQLLAHGNQDASVVLRMMTQPTEPLAMSGYTVKVRALSWDQSSRYLATSGSQKVCVWDCGGRGPAGRKPQLLEGHSEPITGVRWQNRGFLLASGGPEGQVKLWQPANLKGPLVGQAAMGAAPVALAWSPDDKHLAAGTSAGQVQLFRIH